MSAGKIGSADLSANTDTDLTSGGLSEDKVANVCLCNRSGSTATVRIAIGSGVSAAATDYLEYGATIPAGGVLERTGIAVSSGEKIWVRSDIASVSARAHGLPAA